MDFQQLGNHKTSEVHKDGKPTARGSYNDSLLHNLKSEGSMKIDYIILLMIINNVNIKYI